MFEFEDRFNIKLSSDLKAPATVGEMDFDGSPA